MDVQVKRKYREDLTGQVFGKLTVVNKSAKSTSKGIYWDCDCYCGNPATIAMGHLKSGHTTSCGCLGIQKKPEIQIGQVFTRLTILEESGKTKSYERLWKCSCECGTIKVIPQGSLNSGSIKSCGCLHTEIVRARAKPNGEASKRALFNDYKGNAKKKNRCFELTFSEVVELFNGNCYYCSAAPKSIKQINYNEPFTFNGVDRVDNSIGYIKSNVITACSNCNLAKGELTQEEFLKCIKQIYTNTKLNQQLVNNIIDPSVYKLNIKTLYGRYVRHARNNEREFSLTLEDAIRLFQSNCYYCNQVPSNIVFPTKPQQNNFIYNGIDRMNNGEGYTHTNSISCCSKCNFIKGKINKDEFLQLVNSIYIHLNLESL